jgi:hypothetical protein
MPPPGKSVQIRQPLAVGARRETRCSARVAIAERGVNLVAHFEGARSDSRSEPGDEVLGTRVQVAQRPHRRLQDAGREPAPSGMGDADGAAAAIGE